MANGRESTPGPTGPGYGKLRRTQRVHILMAVLVRGISGGKPFQEETKTTTVNAHGCLISLATPVTRGQQVSIVNPKTAEEVACNVAYISENKGQKTEIGLEFTEASPLFWRIGFPPDDWVDSVERKRPSTSPSSERKTPAGSPRGKNE
jgi:hypothetical protein